MTPPSAKQTQLWAVQPGGGIVLDPTSIVMLIHQQADREARKLESQK
jgi:hypothetical protein